LHHVNVRYYQAMSGTAMNSTHPTDPLAVDQEPTDEQLAAVMDDAARVVREKRALGEARLREALAKEARAAETRMRYLRKQFNLPPR
jgi:hypothetical protein